MATILATDYKTGFTSKSDFSATWGLANFLRTKKAFYGCTIRDIVVNRSGIDESAATSRLCVRWRSRFYEWPKRGSERSSTVNTALAPRTVTVFTRQVTQRPTAACGTCMLYAIEVCGLLRYHRYHNGHSTLTRQQLTLRELFASPRNSF